MKDIVKLYLTLFCFFGFQVGYSEHANSVYLTRQDGSHLEGYFSCPSRADRPIVMAIQGSSPDTVLPWYLQMRDLLVPMDIGLLVIEKYGVSSDNFDCEAYQETNCLSQRLEDYMLCLEELTSERLGWKGPLVLLAESEGGVLAADLAQMTNPAALLLFSVGGGMTPREEAEWALVELRKRLGANEEQLQEYKETLKDQMDAMICNPTFEESFFGNTYHWWASFLMEESIVSKLKKIQSPIFMLHGVKDRHIPILSADIAAENLKNNNLTYLRLEESGHDLGVREIHEPIFKWLQAVLSGEELHEIELPALMMPDFEILDIFQRGKNPNDSPEDNTNQDENTQKSPQKKDFSINGFVEVDAGEGKKKRAEMGIEYEKESKSGWKTKATVSAGVTEDENGKVNKKAKGRVDFGKDF